MWIDGDEPGLQVHLASAGQSSVCWCIFHRVILGLKQEVMVPWFNASRARQVQGQGSCVQTSVMMQCQGL